MKYQSLNFINPNLCERDQALLLCGKKLPLKNALVSDIALIDGISLRIARLIKHEHVTNLDNLITIKGVGPKTIIKLKEYFY